MLTFLNTVNKPAHMIDSTNDDPVMMICLHNVNGTIAANGFHCPTYLITFVITC